MKFGSSEANPQTQLDRLSRLQTALLCLGWTWLSVPGLLIMGTSGSSAGFIGFVCIYLVAFALISGALLARSAESRAESMKIVGIPGLFIAAIFISAYTDVRDLGRFGMSGIFVAPVWLVEILRARAAKYGFHVLGFTLMGHHLFSLFLAWLVYTGPSDPWGLVMIWYGLHIPYFIWFYNLLTEPTEKLRTAVAAQES